MLRIVMALLLMSALAACDTMTDALTPIQEAELSTLSFEVGYTGEEIGIQTDVDGVTPSTNALNKAKEPIKWAYAELAEARVGELDIEFVSQRDWFVSCFEYRVDDAAGAGTNPNPGITDGFYPYFCVKGNSRVETISAASTVDIRMVFGAERDERFDWTRFYVMTETTKDDCKDGAWEALGFKNQGQCIASVVANENSGH